MGSYFRVHSVASCNDRQLDEQETFNRAPHYGFVQKFPDAMIASGSSLLDLQTDISKNAVTSSYFPAHALYNPSATTGSGTPFRGGNPVSAIEQKMKNFQERR